MAKQYPYIDVVETRRGKRAVIAGTRLYVWLVYHLYLDSHGQSKDGLKESLRWVPGPAVEDAMRYAEAHLDEVMPMVEANRRLAREGMADA